MSWLFASGGQSIRASASVLPVSVQGWFPLGLTSLISLQCKGLSRVFPSTTIQKHQFFGTQPSLWSNSHILTWLLEKTIAWLYRNLSAKWCLCFLIHCLGLTWLEHRWTDQGTNKVDPLSRECFDRKGSHKLPLHPKPKPVHAEFTRVFQIFLSDRNENSGKIAALVNVCSAKFRGYE